MDLKELLTRAKNGDNDAKEEIIEMYYPLMVKESKNIFLKNRTFEDLIQIAIVNLLVAIDKFDLSKGEKSFSSYVLWTIKNGFRYLCRAEIRYNDESSLNKPTCEGPEPVDYLVGYENVESEIIHSMDIEIIKAAINTLDAEERELIDFLFYSSEKRTLTKYSVLKGKDYYYCSSLKRRTFNKLKLFFKKSKAFIY